MSNRRSSKHVRLLPPLPEQIKFQNLTLILTSASTIEGNFLQKGPLLWGRGVGGGGEEVNVRLSILHNLFKSPLSHFFQIPSPYEGSPMRISCGSSDPSANPNPTPNTKGQCKIYCTTGPGKSFFNFKKNACPA